MKKEDLAYTAGIIDGEGCIGLHKRGSRNGVYLSVSVGITDEWMCQWLKFAYGGGVYIYYSKNPKWKNHWEWSVAGKRALDFLKLIYPYLRLKKPQAEIAIKFQEEKINRVRTRPLSKEVKVIEEAERILMAQLNKKGRP